MGDKTTKHYIPVEDTIFRGADSFIADGKQHSCKYLVHISKRIDLIDIAEIRRWISVVTEDDEQIMMDDCSWLKGPLIFPYMSDYWAFCDNQKRIFYAKAGDKFYSGGIFNGNKKGGPYIIDRLQYETYNSFTTEDLNRRSLFGDVRTTHTFQTEISFLNDGKNETLPAQCCDLGECRVAENCFNEKCNYVERELKFHKYPFLKEVHPLNLGWEQDPKWIKEKISDLEKTISRWDNN